MLGGSVIGLASNFSLLDGGMVGVYLVVVMVAGILVRKYVSKVDEFLLAGRELNIYLGIASLAATEFGIVTCMYSAQNGYDLGFSGMIIGILEMSAMIIVGLTGFCLKPLRNAGVITIPELFDKVYGKKVRWLSGVVIVLGGLLNMGVFLRTGGDFLVMCCGLNLKYLVITMASLLACVAIYTVLGGLLSVLITDFLQFIVMSAGLIIITILIFAKVGWGTMVDTVQTHYGASGFNPLANPSKQWAYFVYNAIAIFACVITWQTMIQHALAAKNSTVARKIYTRTSFFFACRFILPGLWGIAALAMLPADWKQNLLAALPSGSIIANQLVESPDRITMYAMPTFLATFVPIGLMGLLVAAMLAADMSTDAVYMLSWAGVIYNDILGPFRKNWSEKRGIMLNRFIVACIGLFLFFFGLWWPLRGNLWQWIIATGTIYMSSMSVLLIACCYWKRANSWGAGPAIIIGAALPITYLILEQATIIMPKLLSLVGLTTTERIMESLTAMQEYVRKFGLEKWGIATFALAAAAMIIGSLIKPGKTINVVAAEAAAKTGA